MGCKYNAYDGIHVFFSLQQMYLLPEGTIPGKGANTTVSILHHALETGYSDKKFVDVCCDNCGGQTYNNIAVKYFLWRTMMNKQSKMMVIFINI